MARHPLYHEQLAFLSEAGRSMSQAYPRVADALGQAGKDPDVERLLEGIAFVSSKITERYAVGVTEIAQLHFDLLFPHYLCPVPSATIVQLAPAVFPGRPILVPRGTEITSVPVLGTSCRFRTSAEVELTDLRIDGIDWQPHGTTTALTLWLTAAAPVLAPGHAGDRAPPVHDRLRLHLHGEPLLTRSLFEWLCTRTRQVELLDRQALPVARLPLAPRAAGFDDDQALLSYPVGSFSGFRLLQEYFSLPQKFLFVDLPGALSALARQTAGQQRFGLRFDLDVTGHSLMVADSNIRLDCCPAVNLFDHTADPVRRDHGRVDYRVRPSGPHLHYEIYRVLDVTGTSRHGEVAYPLLSELDLQQRGPTFAQTYRRVFGATVETYLFVQDEGGRLPVDQTLLIDLLASNGQLPTALSVGDLREVAAMSSEVEVANIIPPTRPAAPPPGEELRRRLVKHLALSQQDLVSIDALRTAIELYDLPALVDDQANRALDLLLEALRDARSEPLQTRLHGRPIWGRATHLAVDEQGFESEGELYLFGCVINEYVARQSAINNASQLTLRGTQREVSHRWPIRVGTRALSDFSAS